LAVHVAHAVRDRFPDGQVYVDMHAASGRPLTVGQVASRILRDIGVPDETIPSDEQERVALYRSALAGQRVLIVLDDARDGAHTRALLPASGASAVLLTSRSRVVELAALSRLELDVMDHAEASTMFGRIVGADRASAEPKAVSAILAACGYLPLAVRIAASRLATRPRWTVGTLAGRLSEAARRLDELSVDDQQTRSAFEFGYQVLPDHLAGAFRMLAISDVGEISTAAAAALLDVDARTAEQRAESLVDMNLLDTIAPGRYRYHELVRLFAREKAGRVESSAERDRALSRLLAMYHDITQAAAQVVYPGIPGTHDGRRAFDDADDARAWLDAEYRNVVLTLIQCSTMDRPDPARLAQTLDHIRWYLQAGGHWSCWGGVAEAVLDCAVRVGVPSAERTIRHHLATIAARDGTGHLGGELVSCPPADHRSRVVGDP
jgi:hypothetical protein